MAVHLSASDFKKLVTVLASQPDFKDVRSRQRLITGALEGSPRAHDLLGQIDLDGTPRGVAVEVIQRLASFGRLTPDKESLGVLLNYVLFFKGDADQDASFISDVIQRYTLDHPLLPSEPISDWRGAQSADLAKEIIIGEDTLRHIRVLELALEASKAVVRIAIPGGAGSGFMVAQDLVMTNHHVIPTQADADQAEISFNYQLDHSGIPCQTLTTRADPHTEFYTNDDLDITVVQVREPPPFGKPLVLRPAQVAPPARVAIIQHPGGHYKKISMQNNFVAYGDTRVVQYVTSTLPGSSGSPVFDDEFQAVAIHHSGGRLVEPSTGTSHRRNAGTSMIAVLDELQKSAPAIRSRLVVRDS
jgi:V8-like Glu-specific endopeptidase